MLGLIAQLVRRRPGLVLAGWLLLVVAALPLAARVGEVLTAQPAAPAGSVAERVRTLLGSEFSRQDDYSVVLVSRARGDRVGEVGFDRAYDRVVAAIQGIPGVTGVRDHRRSGGLPLEAEDGSYALSLIGLQAGSLGEAKSQVDLIRKVLERSGELDYELAGGPASTVELEEISARDAQRAELFGLPLSMAVLVIAFGALVASGLPLLVALTSISLSFAALFLLGQVLEFAVFTQSIVTMLGLATGIDYALLMVSRFREELRQDGNSREAAARTALTAGRAVVFSGLTVILALMALLVPPLEFIRSIGVGAIAVLSVSVLVSVSALPAALALLGHRVDWLRVTRRVPGQRSRAFWEGRARLILRRPWAWALGGGALLLLLSAPALTMQVADPGPRGLSATTDSRRVAAALADLGLEGLLKPFDVLVDFGEQGFFHPSSQRQLSRFGREVEALENTDRVYSAMSLDGLPRLLLYQYYATRESALRSEVGELVRATVSESGRYALVQVLPAGEVTPAESAELARGVARVAEGVGLRVLIGGGQVFDAEWRAELYRSFPLAVALVYLAILLVLGLAFRSVVIPLKAIVLNTLTVSAAYGVITLVFQDGVLAPLFGLSGGLGYVDTSAPLFLFAIVFGLSMDYEVFLVARIFEAHERGVPDRQAVVEALGSTGGVISSAAAVMIVVFASFVFSEVVLIKTLGLGLAVAVLLDATVVRLMLVPAVMTLAGRWNWWLPRPVARFAEHLGLRH